MMRCHIIMRSSCFMHAGIFGSLAFLTAGVVGTQPTHCNVVSYAYLPLPVAYAAQPHNALTKSSMPCRP